MSEPLSLSPESATALEQRHRNAAAAECLNRAGLAPDLVTLFLPHAAKCIGVDLVEGSVFVIDPVTQRHRHGYSLEHLGREIADEYDPNRTKYFRRA